MFLGMYVCTLGVTTRDAKLASGREFITWGQCGRLSVRPSIFSNGGSVRPYVEVNEGVIFHF
jgi:hypothetical protein